VSVRPFPVAILAGGLATRLNPVTLTIPKSMIEVNGTPFIAHQLRRLASNGIERAVICGGHLIEMIQEFVGDGKQFNINVSYSVDGPKLLGTAGALKTALPLLGDSFTVLYGDSYLTCDFAAVQRSFENQSGKLALMTVYRNLGLYDTSNVEFENGRIVAYNKKNLTPRMQHIDYGLGMFHSKAFEKVPAGKVFDLAMLYQGLLNEGQLAAFEVKERFYEIGSFEGIRQTEEFLRSMGSADKNSQCKGPPQ
jgi:N-acetyl-alpha-D-muramate 1-phosphate uridylyltransferase